MENFEINSTKTTPAVYFHPCGILKLMGRSLPEDTIEWYSKLNSALNEFIKTGKSIEITIEMDYINSSSSKAILDLLKIPVSANIDTSIIWNYEEDDEDILELGEIYQEALNIDFQFKPYVDHKLIY